MSVFEENYNHPYTCDPLFSKRAAYFSMEFAIDPCFKIYSGGLGFLAGSHMKSAYELKQNLVGIGILWKYGYYDQVRRGDQTMDALFQEKIYSFLEDTGIRFQIEIDHSPVWVTAKYLAPGIFQTVPMFFLTTDLPENDYIAQSVCHHLYDANEAAKIAQCILLGIGGAKLLDELGYGAETYHMNEAHPLPLVFHLYKHYQDLEEVKKRVVFTTHTPEEAGNEKRNIHLLNKMGFFNGTNLDEVRFLSGAHGDMLDYSLTALRFSRIANGVSQLHGKVSNQMWSHFENICPIIAITNAQNYNYWSDKEMYDALEKNDDERLVARKRYLKSKTFAEVATQTGDLFSPDVLTIVWARRFAGYKRADLLTWDMQRFERLLANTEHPVQVIWAGKPYPMDYDAISVFNKLVHLSKKHKNMAVLVGYEIRLSKLLKMGADIWLNNPRVTREASGTSGMTAAMNGAINFSTNDGWIPEFATEQNTFLVPAANLDQDITQIDQEDLERIYDMLENRIIPMYYQQPRQWTAMMKVSMTDVVPAFDSGRMAAEYYQKMY